MMHTRCYIIEPANSLEVDMAGLLRPYAGTHPITQPFLGTIMQEPVGYVASDLVVGQRPYRAGWTKRYHIHLAQDVGMPIGTDLLAPCAGRIVAEGTYSSTGEHYLMILFHKDAALQTLIFYTHIKDGGLLLPVGRHVSAGQHVAESGASGHVTGPHLHWEIRRAAANLDPHLSGSWPKIDPKECLVGGRLAGASWLVPNI